MRKFEARLAKDQSGFTLIEVLVTVMIMIVVLFALYGIFDMGLRVFSYGNNKIEAVENARIGIERMKREIRAAYPVDRNNPERRHLFFDANGVTSNPPEDIPKDDEITFGNDLGSGNGRIECGNPCEYITYSLDGTTLRRANAADSSITAGDPVVEFVEPGGLAFTYFKDNGDELTSSELANPDNEDLISAVRIQLAITTDGAQPGSQTLTTDVKLRNRE